MRVAVGGLWHETNSFAAERTGLERFEVHEGASLVEAFKGTRTPIGGFLDGGLPLVPALYASATPSGLVDRAAFEELAGRLIERVARETPDGLLLDLHGAMVVDGIDEVEGELLRRLRGRLGRVPIGVVLDFHANLSPLFIEQVDVFAAYDTYPHVDPYERGVEVAGLLARTMAGRVRPTRALVPAGFLTVPQAQRTDVLPMRALLERAREAERRPGVLRVTVAGGFPYADVPHAGLAVAATTDAEPELAREIAEEIAAAAGAAREAFRVRNLPPAEAVARALREPEGPVILVDQADNIGGGGPGDGTALLAELLRAGVEDAVVTIADPETVARAKAAGVGGSLSCEIGGKTDRLHGPPVRVDARVLGRGRGALAYSGS
jgi:microcystin degradation protein MlrC